MIITIFIILTREPSYLFYKYPPQSIYTEEVFAAASIGSIIYGSKYSITSSNVSTKEIIVSTAVSMIYTAIPPQIGLQQITSIVSNASTTTVAAKSK